MSWVTPDYDDGVPEVDDAEPDDADVDHTGEVNVPPAQTVRVDPVVEDEEPL